MAMILGFVLVSGDDGGDGSPGSVATTSDKQPPLPTLPRGVEEADDLPDRQRSAYEDALVESAAPAPDRDGDPTTIAGVLPDGRKMSVIMQTSQPQDFEGVDIDELVDQDE